MTERSRSRINHSSEINSSFVLPCHLCQNTDSFIPLSCESCSNMTGKDFFTVMNSLNNMKESYRDSHIHHRMPSVAGILRVSFPSTLCNISSSESSCQRLQPAVFFYLRRQKGQEDTYCQKLCLGDNNVDVKVNANDILPGA